MISFFVLNSISAVPSYSPSSRKRRAHVAQHFAVVGLGVEPRRAAAEQLLPGQELLVHLQAGDQAHGLVVQTIEHPASLL